MAKLYITSTNRNTKCRLCNELIMRLENCIVLERVHVSPRYVNLFFHLECMSEVMENLG